MSGKEATSQPQAIERPAPGGGHEERGYDRLPQLPPTAAYDKLKPAPADKKKR
jgi:hypothetical protein